MEVNAPLQVLSHRYNWVGQVAALVAVPYYAQLLVDVTDSPASLSIGEIALLLLIPLGGWALYTWLQKGFGTAYTSESLFINKRTGVAQIPLTHIYQIKYVFFKTYYRHHWKIGYYDTQGQQQVIQILPVSSHVLDEFIATVRRQNPRVEIRHWYLFFQ